MFYAVRRKGTIYRWPFEISFSWFCFQASAFIKASLNHMRLGGAFAAIRQMDRSNKLFLSLLKTLNDSDVR